MHELNIRKIRRSSKKLTPEESKEEETDGEAEADDGKLVQLAGTA